jgi:hypothetical protein
MNEMLEMEWVEMVSGSNPMRPFAHSRTPRITALELKEISQPPRAEDSRPKTLS